MSNIEDGIKRINKAVSHYKEYSNDKIIFIEGLRNFGDTLHSSLVVRHYRKIYPNHLILWGISERYYKEFDNYAQLIGVVVFPLPHNVDPDDRRKWKKHCDNLKLFKSIFPLCAVTGWNIGGNIVDNVLHNAGIKKLSVPRKPFFPHGIEDYQWCDNFIINNNLKGKKFIALEYNSYTLSQPPHNNLWSVDKYNNLLKNIQFPVINIGSERDRELNCGIDARGCTWKQAKVLIERSACMIGCGSGLSVLASCDGMKTKVFELNIGDPLLLKNIYKHDSQQIRTDNPMVLANIVNKFVRSFKR